MTIRTIALFVAVIAGASAAHASVPIVVETGAGRRTAMKRVADAGEELKNGNVAAATGDVDAALSDDPKSWPALYMRAQIFARQGKYERAIQDCEEMLHLYPGFVEVALLRANINVRLWKYAEALKEFNYLISLHPRRVTLARALSDRAWFEATCPNASFRNGQQAVKDAKAACSIMV